MNIAAISFGNGKKELSQRKFQAKLREHLLNQIEAHQESEFERLLKEGYIKKDENGKVWFANPWEKKK
jgi:hypothetical protein